jgi:Tol biopolymer transport system component/aminoglycoside phosphotransferase (APT) family kinase protein
MGTTVGSVVGHYRILGRLGGGGMGVVYEAEDETLGRKVALKFLAPELAGDAEGRKRLLAEARAASRLDHPNVCTVYEVGEDEEGRGWIAMARCGGETLAAKLARGPLPVAEATRVVTQIARALAQAHALGIVHRDVKPANVMVTDDGAVKVLDFGLAKLDGVALTRSRTTLGTAAYMAPEQLRGGRCGPAADVWSLGVLFFELLAGVRPFRGDYEQALAYAIVHEPPLPLGDLRPDAPPEIAGIIDKTLRKEASARYANAGELLADLEAAAPASGGPARAIGPRAAARRRLRAWWSRARLGWRRAAAYAAVAAVVAAAMAIASRSRPPDGGEPPAIHAELTPPEGWRLTQVATGPVALSPDGRQVVFRAYRGESTWLFVRDVASGRTLALAEARRNAYPFWSPDGRRIAFFADDELKVVGAGGGPVRSLCRAPQGRGGAWSAGGTILFSSHRQSLQRTPESGGAARRVYPDVAGFDERLPHFLADGRRFLYIRRRIDTGAGALMIGSLDGAPPRTLAEGVSNAAPSAGHLLYARGGNLEARPFDERSGRFTGPAKLLVENVETFASRAVANFSATPAGHLVYVESLARPARIVRYSPSGELVGTLGDLGHYASPRFSPDGRRVALPVCLDAVCERAEISIFDLARGTRSVLGSVARAPGYVVWSRDGRAVVWSEHVGDRAIGRIVSLAAPGEERRAYDFAAGTTLARVEDWTPDGRRLVLGLYERGTLWDVAMIEVGVEGAEPVPVVTSPVSEWGPRLSPDGKWLAFMADYLGRRTEVHLTRFPEAGERIQVTADGGYYPVWSADGTGLYYVSSDGELHAVDVDLDAAPTIGRPRVLTADLGPRMLDQPSALFDVAPDGSIVGVKPPEEPQRAIHFLTDWRTLLRER